MPDGDTTIRTPGATPPAPSSGGGSLVTGIPHDVLIGFEGGVGYPNAYTPYGEAAHDLFAAGGSWALGYNLEVDGEIHPVCPIPLQIPPQGGGDGPPGPPGPQGPPGPPGPGTPPPQGKTGAPSDPPSVPKTGGDTKEPGDGELTPCNKGRFIDGPDGHVTIGVEPGDSTTASAKASLDVSATFRTPGSLTAQFHPSAGRTRIQPPRPPTLDVSGDQRQRLGGGPYMRGAPLVPAGGIRLWDPYDFHTAMDVWDVVGGVIKKQNQQISAWNERFPHGPNAVDHAGLKLPDQDLDAIRLDVLDPGTVVSTKRPASLASPNARDQVQQLHIVSVDPKTKKKIVAPLLDNVPERVLGRGKKRESISLYFDTGEPGHKKIDRKPVIGWDGKRKTLGMLGADTELEAPTFYDENGRAIENVDENGATSWPLDDGTTKYRRSVTGDALLTQSVDDGGTATTETTLDTSTGLTLRRGLTAQATTGKARIALLSGDANGAIELGDIDGTTAALTPYIDFHFSRGVAEDFNARIINDADQKLRFVSRSAGSFSMAASASAFDVGFTHAASANRAKTFGDFDTTESQTSGAAAGVIPVTKAGGILDSSFISAASLPSDVAYLDVAQTWAALQKFKTSHIHIVDASDVTKQVAWDLTAISAGTTRQRVLLDDSLTESTTGGLSKTIPVTGGTGVLAASFAWALTGDATSSAGSAATTVGKINGASVPAAGSLTTGNVLQVTGASALGYAAVNLAGGANFVTGTLPIGNGGTGLTAVGTLNTLPRWGASTLVDSAFTDDGSTASANRSTFQVGTATSGTIQPAGTGWDLTICTQPKVSSTPALTIRGADGPSGSIAGGTVVVRGGDAAASGTAGKLSFRAGASVSGTSGDLEIQTTAGTKKIYITGSDGVVNYDGSHKLAATCTLDAGASGSGAVVKLKHDVIGNLPATLSSGEIYCPTDSQELVVGLG